MDRHIDQLNGGQTDGWTHWFTEWGRNRRTDILTHWRVDWQKDLPNFLQIHIVPLTRWLSENSNRPNIFFKVFDWKTGSRLGLGCLRDSLAYCKTCRLSLEDRQIARQVKLTGLQDGREAKGVLGGYLDCYTKRLTDWLVAVTDMTHTVNTDKLTDCRSTDRQIDIPIVGVLSGRQAYKLTDSKADVGPKTWRMTEWQTHL